MSLRYNTNMPDELRHEIFRILKDCPDISQRDLAARLGVSLGKANYCLRALIQKGWIKARNFKNSKNKLAYAYYLTSAGIEEKARLTFRFLKRKVREYEDLVEVIEDLKKEAEEMGELLFETSGIRISEERLDESSEDEAPKRKAR